MEEQFIQIEDDVDFSISNKGRLKSNITKKILKPFKNQGGYLVYNFLERNLISKSELCFVQSIHRLVAQSFIPNPHNKPIVDHIDNNRMNNNINNLRWATHQENNTNKSVNYNSKSGAKGIIYNVKNKKWNASITKDKIKYNLGKYDSKEDAIKARVNKSKELFGEFQSKHEKDLVIELNIKANTKRNIVIKLNIEDEDYKKLEEEFEQKLN